MKKMIINSSEAEEIRVAIMDEGVLEEFYLERNTENSYVGNIYLGKIVNVEKSIQAAFINIGDTKNGFLHISDVMPSFYPKSAKRRRSSRHGPPIQKIFKKDQEIPVQVIREGLNNKGPTLTTYLSLPGRYLVMMPGILKRGVSRKIVNEDSRQRLKKILDDLEPPVNVGFIVRTAGENKNKRELARDLNYLVRLWKVVQRRIKNSKAPAPLYQESDLLIRAIRDYFSTGISEIIVDEETSFKKAKEFLKIVMPRQRQKVRLYKGAEPMFHHYGIEQELEKINSRTVNLPGGGYLVIDQTEALVAIDVNTGSFRRESNQEQTAYKINMSAAKEIPRQLRLRDLSGVIVCDFIDMSRSQHIREVEKTLNEEIRKDRAKIQALRMSRFGLIEITRQRMRSGIHRATYVDCPHCAGSGKLKSVESMSIEVMRKLRSYLHHAKNPTVVVRLHPEVAAFLYNKKRRELVELENKSGKKIDILANDEFIVSNVEFKEKTVETTPNT